MTAAVFPTGAMDMFLPSNVSVEESYIGPLELFIYKMEIIIHEPPTKYKSQTVMFTYLHPICFLFQINTFEGCPTFPNGTLYGFYGFVVSFCLVLK
jgi:hypothetical protein